MLKWVKDVARWVREPATKVASALALAGVVAVVIVQLTQDTPNGTTLVLTAIAIALLFGLLAPRHTAFAIDRMTNLKLAGVIEIGLGAVSRAENVRPPSYDEDGVIDQRKGQGYVTIVKTLKEKMRFVHAITYLRDQIEDERSYHEIAHALASAHLLNEEEAELVLDLISERDLGLSALPIVSRDEFLDAAWSFAARFGFVVWDRYVRSELWKNGWVIADFRQPPGHRRSFLACWEGDWILMSARVGETYPYPYMAVRRRLAETKFKFPVMGRCIVIPGGDRKATVIGEEGEGAVSSVKVLQLQGSLLEHPTRAFLADPCNQDGHRPAT